ncbi:hypothetical protein AKJ37_06440, partial [candidate division MSBL1 archaeon SCGC-AAA259I09]
AWGEEEIIGWMYQYFKSKEKDKAFEELQKNNKKIDGSTLPAVSCIYTPDWIVRYLVDNTLGVLWKEMNPDSSIDEFCEYIVPDQEFEEREKKPIEEITLLDPACGSGHFLLYAYEVFEKMYEESGYTKEEIPEKILSNNLYGVDVDNRSVQLSALSLYIKGKTENPSAKIKDINLISADAVLMDGEKKERLLKKCKNPVEKEIIKEMWDNFQHLDERGSLVKVKESVRKRIQQYKASLSEEEKKQQYLDQFSSETIKKKETSVQQKLAERLSTEDYWNMIEDRMIQRIRELGEEAIQSRDMSEQLFATETEKTLHLLDYLMGKYDCVTTNPPYLYRRNMNSSMKSFLKEYYRNASKDYYSAFIKKCLDFSKERGYVGTITQDTFMFLSGFTSFRKNILKRQLRTCLHLGTHVFEGIKGEKVRSSAFTIRNSQEGLKKSIFVRLVNSTSKKKKLERIMENSSDRVFKINADEFKSIANNPICYWASNDLIQIFKENPSLQSYAESVTGMQTNNNKKYLRYWWEVEDFDRWKVYNKGGDFCRYFGNQKYVVDWSSEAVSNYSSINKEYQGKKGITYSSISSKGFNARLMPSGQRFDNKGSAVFPKLEKYIHPLLGYLNTRVADYFLTLMNPTHSYQPGEIGRLPCPNLKSIEFGNSIKRAIEIKKSMLASDETSKYFSRKSFLSDLNEKESLTSYLKDNIRKKEEKRSIFGDILSKIEEKIIKYFDLSDIRMINEIIGPNPFSYNKISDFSQEEISLGNISKRYLDGEDIDKIAIKFKKHPYSVLEALREEKVYRKKDLKKELKNLLSYFIQVSLGRWEMDGVEPDEDGILMVSEGVSENNPSLIEKIRECIAAEWGESKVSDIESEINSILYHGMEKWIKKYFFKNFHYKMYKKRPVVWQLQTPDNHFSAFIYYHKLDEDTLPKLDSIYINPLISYYSSQREIAEKNEDTVEAKKMDDKVQDLKEFQDQIGEIIDRGYEPDLDEGVKHNFKPLEHLTPVEMK